MAICLKQIVTCVFVLFGIFNSSVSSSNQVWSPWYNSSPGSGQDVEDETLQRIASTHEMPCKPEDAIAVQCREAGSNSSFSGVFRYKDNVLHVPCNVSGLVCRHHDQILAGTSPCVDYEVRVLCVILDDDDDDDDDLNDNSDFNDFGPSGGFIAMAAGGSVVIPLICVLVIQLRKSKREERQRQEEARRAAEDLARAQEAARMLDAPPAYEELFGGVSVISDQVGESGSSARRSSTERLVSAAQTNRLEGQVNPGASVELGSSSVESADSASTTVSSRLGESGPSGNGSETSLPSSNSGRSSVSSSSDSSTASDHPLLPSTISGSDVMHHGPPPAYDWQRPSHVTVVMPTQDGGDESVSGSGSDSFLSSGRGSEQCVRGEGGQGRRFLGMHLSIFDLMAVIYPDLNPTPPPSYDDALKILGVPSQPDVQIT